MSANAPKAVVPMRRPTKKPVYTSWGAQELPQRRFHSEIML